MVRIAAASPVGISPSEDAGGAGAALHDIGVADIASVGGAEGAVLFGQHVDSEDYRLRFERAIIGVAGNAAPAELAQLFDADFPSINDKGESNRPAVSQSLVAAMEHMNLEEPWSYAPVADRYAEIILQPPTSQKVSQEQAIQTRLANWTQGLDANQTAAIRLAVTERQQASRPPAPTNWAAAAPPLDFAVSGLLASAGVARA